MMRTNCPSPIQLWNLPLQMRLLNPIVMLPHTQPNNVSLPHALITEIILHIHIYSSLVYAHSYSAAGSDPSSTILNS